MGSRIVILLDTHVLVWLAEGNSRLGKEALRVMDTALAKEELAASSISFWEVAMLVRKGRIELKGEVDAWRRDLLGKGLQEIPLYGGMAIRAGELPNFHGDPADRMIVATALETSATLATADDRILSWSKSVNRIDARR
ncbi:MAG: type II toxin-antitoxin system VapC family toxin [Desulfobulbaceae bacterium]